MSINFPDGANYYFAIQGINEKFGGLTRAMLRRAKLFEEQEIYSKIITFDYNHNYDTIRKDIYNEQLISPRTKIINMYEELANEEEVEIDPITYQVADDDYIVEPVKGRECYRYFKNGLYTMYKSFEGKDQRLKFIDYFNAHHYKVEREEYDNNGIKRRHLYVDYLNSKHSPSQELYYNRQGKCYLNIWYKTVDDKKVVERIHYFVDNQVKVFSNITALRKFWLENYFNKAQKNFVVVDSRSLDPLFLQIDGDHIYKSFIFHSTHLREPYHIDSVLRLGNRDVLNNLAEINGLILLTNKQKEDILDRVGDKRNLSVIPHSIDLNKEDLIDASKRDQFKGVMVARYHEEKRIDHVIKAYAKVVKEVPQATLDIYGFGVEEDKLNRLIKELDLSNNVFLKGFTENTDEVFRSAAYSILTSKYEGFGMSLVESLSNGCPLICYDIKYGPSDMIEDGKNGFLVKDGNIDGLAQKIIELISNKELIDSFSIRAIEKAKEFSNEEFIENWSKHFNDLIERKENSASFNYKLQTITKLPNNCTYSYVGEINYLSDKKINDYKDCEIGLVVNNKENFESVEILSDESSVNHETVKLVIDFSKHLTKLEKHTTWDVSLFIRQKRDYVETPVLLSNNDIINQEILNNDNLLLKVNKDTDIHVIEINKKQDSNEPNTNENDTKKAVDVKGQAKSILKKLLPK